MKSELGKDSVMNSTISLFDLTGRTVLITGGGGALGSAIGLGLSKVGAEVIIADINLENASKVADKIKSTGGVAHAFEGDLSKESEVEELFAKIDKIAPLNILVNAISAPQNRFSPDLMPLKDWEKTITDDLTSFFLTSRAAAQRMIKSGKGGSIVNFSSIAGATSLGRGSVAYGAAKAGVIQLTRDCSFEWAHHGIRVNSILPCQFDNSGWDAYRKDPARAKLVERVISGIPMGRFGSPEEMVGPVLFLASDAASMVTGIAMPVDGGNLAMNPGGSIEW
ncbi:FabG Dehydrogenases with different specificities (related to short-chain alcohol dehydrogenases) [Candidatus Nanopelagicaceae bacterium]